MSMSRNYSDTFEAMTATLRCHGMSDTGLITQTVLHQGDFPIVRDYFLKQVSDASIENMETSPALAQSIEDFIHVITTAEDFSTATASFGLKVINAMIEDPSVSLMG